MEKRFANTSKGFTLVEVMIAMVLGLVLAAAIITVFVQNRHSFDTDDSIVRMQDDARQAVQELANDLSVSGYFADLILPGSVTLDGSLAVATDCGPAATANWIYQVVSPLSGDSLALTGVDNATGGTASGSYSCIDPAEIVPGTDVIAVKRVAGATLVGAPAANTVYLRTNGTVGLLYRAPIGVAPTINVPPPFREWEYRPRIYYIRNYSTTPGDGIPMLCRKVLQFGGAPTVGTECLAQGIENLQIEYGLDPDGDGQPNFFIPNPTSAQLQTAVSARIFVLARSADRDINYVNQKTYQLSNAPAYAPGDNFYRRVFSVTVGLRNLTALRRLRS